MDNSLRLRPIEVIRLRIRYASFLEERHWNMLLRYSILGYSHRGYRKFHNYQVRKLFRQIMD